jgi:hypothetical protein
MFQKITFMKKFGKINLLLIKVSLIVFLQLSTKKFELLSFRR